MAGGRVVCAEGPGEGVDAVAEAGRFWWVDPQGGSRGNAGTCTRFFLPIA